MSLILLKYSSYFKFIFCSKVMQKPMNWGFEKYTFSASTAASHRSLRPESTMMSHFLGAFGSTGSFTSPLASPFSWIVASAGGAVKRKKMSHLWWEGGGKTCQIKRFHSQDLLIMWVPCGSSRSGNLICTLWSLVICWIREPLGPIIERWNFWGITHSMVTWAS